MTQQTLTLTLDSADWCRVQMALIAARNVALDYANACSDTDGAKEMFSDEARTLTAIWTQVAIGRVAALKAMPEATG